MLYSGMGMYQLGKIGTLVQHLSRHQTETKTSGFFELLVQHYTRDSAEDGDDDETEDAKLPFKSFVNGSFSPCIMPAALFKSGAPTAYRDNIYSLPQDERFHNSFSSYVFRPPNGR